MGVKDFFTKKLLERQMKNMPEDQKEMMVALIQDHPEFFEKIANEIKKKKAEGKGDAAATMEVMRKHQAQLQEYVMDYQSRK